MTTNRIPQVLALLALGTTAALGITGCAPATSTPAPAVELAAGELATDVELAAEVELATELELVAESETLDAPGADSGLRKAGKARQLLRKNSLHGEVTVQTKNGVKTVAAQRGSVTAVTATSVTVKSADGFTATWTFGDKLRVRQDKKDAERSAITTGADVAVAGAKDGATTTARLIVVRK
jgi:hypothetical protein